MFKINREATVEEIRKKDPTTFLQLGGDNEKVKKIVDSISDCAEYYESETITDMYGSNLISIPVDEMENAVVENINQWESELEIQNRKIYLLRDIIRSYMKHGLYKSEEGQNENKYSCVIFGH